MKKLLTVILAAIWLLVACGGNTPAPTPTSDRGGRPPQPSAAPTLPLTPPGLPAGGFPLLDAPLDGQIVYNNGDGDIYLIEPKPGAKPRKLIRAPNDKGFLQDPAWSPDGQRVAYAYLLPFDTTGLPAEDILSANADGSNPQTVVAHQIAGEVYASPAYSSDGRALYYSHSKPIYKDKAITGVTLTLERFDLQTKQTSEVAKDGTQPASSPDGKRITFVRINPETFQQDLMIADADGKNLEAVVPGNSLGGGINGPHWSCDGKRIIFAAPNFSARRNQPANQQNNWFVGWLVGWFSVSVAEAHGPPWDFWSVDTTGQQLQRLTQIGEDEPQAVYAPDCKHFAFVGVAGFYIVDANGKNVRWLTREGGRGRVDWKK